MGQSWKQQGWRKADSYSFTGQDWKGSALRRPFQDQVTGQLPHPLFRSRPIVLSALPLLPRAWPFPHQDPCISFPAPAHPLSSPGMRTSGPRSSTKHPRGVHRAHREGFPEPEPRSNEERCRLGNGVVGVQRSFISTPRTSKIPYLPYPQNPPTSSKQKFSAPSNRTLHLHTLGCFSNQLPEASKLQFRVITVAQVGNFLF